MGERLLVLALVLVIVIERNLSCPESRHHGAGSSAFRRGSFTTPYASRRDNKRGHLTIERAQLSSVREQLPQALGLIRLST